MSPKRRTDKLPPYVYKRKNTYILGRYDKETRKTTYTTLCGIRASLGEVWRRYEEESGDTGDSGTFRWLSGEYQQSQQFAEKAPKTQKEYKAAHRRICATETNSGALLGDFPLSAWKPSVVQKYLDRNADRAVAGNREKAYMSLVFSWGLARDYVKTNPAKGVKRNKEKARDRYVTDAEYQAVYADAPDHVRIVMEIAAMCRARLVEVLMLTRDSILEEGLYLKRVKGSKDAIISWTPRLRAAIEAAQAYPKSNPFAPHLLQSKDGKQMRESTIQSAWQRITPKPTFTLHDLKAKGVSDFDGDKVAAGGWKDAKMVNVYDRKVTTIGPTE